MSFSSWLVSSSRKFLSTRLFLSFVTKALLSMSVNESSRTCSTCLNNRKCMNNFSFLSYFVWICKRKGILIMLFTEKQYNCQKAWTSCWKVNLLDQKDKCDLLGCCSVQLFVSIFFLLYKRFSIITEMLVRRTVNMLRTR